MISKTLAKEIHYWPNWKILALKQDAEQKGNSELATYCQELIAYWKWKTADHDYRREESH